MAVEELIRMQALGEEAEKFIASNLGKFLVGKAEGEIFDAVELLKSVDPVQTDEVRKLQYTIKQAENFQFWLAEAVQEGYNAMQSLELMESTD